MIFTFRTALTALMALVTLAFTTLPATAVATGYLQCAPFARAESGIQLFGNARDWWHQAAGRYERGQEPRAGAVMAFAPTRAMPVGHVAVVSRVVSDREVLLTHANWSPINGRRGQVERNVRAVDVSPNGDWSMVRVWYAPIGDLGLRANPVAGFIYNEGDTPAPAAPTADPSAAIAAIATSVVASL